MKRMKTFCMKSVALATLIFSTSAFPIVNGQLVTQGNPLTRFSVALGWGGGSNFASFCSGTLISNQYVLTAAHCLLASSYFRIGFFDGVQWQVRTVISTTPYPAFPTNPDWSADYLNDDLGLIQFAGGAPAGFQPVPLYGAAGMDIPASATVTQAGVGRPSPTGSDGTLRSISYLPLSIHTDGYIYTTAIPNGGATCNGDSGSPSLIQMGANYVQFGVLSGGGKNCQSPSYLVDLRRYISWIVSYCGSSCSVPPPSGNVVIVSTGLDNALYEKDFNPNTGLASPFILVGGDTSSVRAVSPVLYPDGDLVLIVLGLDNAVYEKKFNPYTGTANRGFRLLGQDPSQVKAISSVLLPDGAILLTAIGLDNAVYEKIFYPTNGWATGFYKVGNDPSQVKAISSVLYPGGNVVIFAIGLDNAVYEKLFNPLNGGATPFYRVGNDPAQVKAIDPILQADGNGWIALNAIGLDNAAYVKYFHPGSGAASVFNSVGGDPSQISALSSVYYLNGNIILSALGLDSAVYEKIFKPGAWATGFSRVGNDPSTVLMIKSLLYNIPLR